MKKSLFRSTIILIIVSIIAKILSFLVRILLARTLSETAMNYYTLASPTLVFIITLAQMGIPAALSKVIAQSSDSKRPVLVCVIISLINNIIISIVFVLILPVLSVTILKQPLIQPVLFVILPLIPFVTISGILKGYLLGIQQHIQAGKSQVYEEAARIIFLIIIFTIRPSMNALEMAKIAMFSLCIGEVSSCIYMLATLRIKKGSYQTLHHLWQQLHHQQFDEVLRISIPMTGSRLIGSLTYFLEPIVMVLHISIAKGNEMMHAYGQLNGYVLPIITMPSFITVTLSNFLLPSFTYHYVRGDYKQSRKLFTMILSLCFLIGMTCSGLCYFFSEELLMLFYHNSHGSSLLKQLAWPFAFYSLQPPLSSMLHALSLSKQSVWDTFWGSLTRILCVLFLTPLCSSNALSIALTLGMLITTILHALRLFYAFDSSFPT